MNFRPTTMRSIFSLSFSGAIGLGLAFAGAGVWALVAQALVQRLTGAIVLWTTIPLKFGLALSSHHLREIRVFAIPMLVGRSMNWGSAQIPRFILGSFLGVTDLGLYSLAARFRDILLQLAIVPRTSVARVELRGYAMEPSGKVEGVKRLLFEMSAFCFPLSCGGAAIAPTLFHVWLDQRWHGGILPAQILLVACFPFVTLYCATSLLLALNEQRSVAFVSSIQTIATVLAVLAAAPFGLVVASIAMAAGPLLALPITLFQVSRRCGVPIGATLGSQTPAFLAASAMGAAVAIAASPLESMFGAPIALPLLVIGGAILYTLMMLVFAPEFALGTIRRLREAIRLRPARMQ